MTRKALPIGVSDFCNAVTNYYNVDKTLLIRDLLDYRWCRFLQDQGDLENL